VTRIEYTDDQVNDLTDAFMRGMDYAISQNPDGRKEFAWFVCTHVIGSLSENRALWPMVVGHYRMLTQRYGQSTYRREVKT